MWTDDTFRYWVDMSKPSTNGNNSSSISIVEVYVVKLHWVLFFNCNAKLIARFIELPMLYLINNWHYTIVNRVLHFDWKQRYACKYISLRSVDVDAFKSTNKCSQRFNCALKSVLLVMYTSLIRFGKRLGSFLTILISLKFQSQTQR